MWKMMLLVGLAWGCSDIQNVSENDSSASTEGSAVVPDSDAANCRPYRARRLNLDSQCLEELIEFGCNNSGCDDEIANALDEQGNCYRMFSCAPPQWQNSIEDTLPEQCDGLAFDSDVPLCSQLLDASADAALQLADEASCSPYRARRLNLDSQCLEELIEFGCNNSGCDDEIANALDEQGNCYRMFSCAPPQWQNSIEDTLPEQCDGLAFDSDVPLCSQLLDASQGD